MSTQAKNCVKTEKTMSDKNFNYSFSAEEQKEIEAIKNKYTESKAAIEGDKLGALRRLDAKVKSKAQVAALCFGILGCLIMGFGMSLIMTNLGAKLGLDRPFALGLSLGVIGMLGVIVAYPVYNIVLDKARKKAAPQILKLSEELLQK